MTGPDRTPDTELAGLPAWLYPAGFWVAVLLLAAGVLFPDLAVWGVAWVGLAALRVLVTGWQKDRRLGMAAGLALLGLGLVVVVRGVL
ncbi:hypothetical protein ACINK0_02905 [Deinococcus sp. VB343]|uniref:Uncharacterized protein n=1 Tax=Deinococcus sp. VB142 TaxID=3112952 RepID=A0AAU6Q158_9DEIO